MPAVNAEVEFVSVKELDKPDNYDNTHRASFKIGDDWFSYGTIKRGVAGEIWTKSGMITKGAEIEFMYDQNGDFKNVKKATVTVLKPGAENSPSPASQAKASKKGTDAYVIGMAVGAAMNQSANLHANDKKLDFDAIEKTAIQMYKIAEQLKHQADAGDIEGAVVEKSPVPANQPAPVDDSFDEDIPF